MFLGQFATTLVSVPDCTQQPRADWPGQVIVASTFVLLALIITIGYVLYIYFVHRKR